MSESETWPYKAWFWKLFIAFASSRLHVQISKLLTFLIFEKFSKSLHILVNFIKNLLYCAWSITRVTSLWWEPGTLWGEFNGCILYSTLTLLVLLNGFEMEYFYIKLATPLKCLNWQPVDQPGGWCHGDIDHKLFLWLDQYTLMFFAWGQNFLLCM